MAMKPRVILSLTAAASLAMSVVGLASVGAQQYPVFAHPAFERVWNRTDSLVAEGRVPRSWFWGPHPNTPGLYETLTDAPDGSGQRLVQYFDKSRMELNNPQANPNDPFYVTNGLLTVELIGGCIQTSTQSPCGEERYPAYIPMSGDSGDQLSPTYAAFGKVANSRFGDHPADDARGQQITATIDRDGNVGTDPSKTAVPLTKYVYYEATTRHNVPEAFWNFLNQVGDVREQGRIVQAPISSPWFYVTGLPISEAYWAKATIRGQVTDVLIQAFERRVLTYTPTNTPAFQVEMGNIGQHYYNWRYAFFGQPGPGTGTPYNTPVGGGTPTVAATNTPGPAGTVSPTAVSTAVVPTRTAVASPTSTPAAIDFTPTATATITPHPGLGTTATPTP